MLNSHFKKVNRLNKKQVLYTGCPSYCLKYRKPVKRNWYFLETFNIYSGF